MAKKTIKDVKDLRGRKVLVRVDFNVPLDASGNITPYPLTGAVSVSCQATHGPGLVGSTAEPPATDGFSASWLVWMFSDGTGTVPPPGPVYVLWASDDR